MKLTGKAQEDFEYYIYSNNKVQSKTNDYGWSIDSFYELSEIYQNALIIEFFDSVGVYICIEPYTNSKNNFVFSYYILHHKNIDEQNTYKNRYVVTNVAIKKANQIYNDK